MVNFSRTVALARVIGHGRQAGMVRGQIEQGDFETGGPAATPGGSNSRTGSRRSSLPCTAICANSRPVNVLVMEPISKRESGFAAP